MYRITNPFLPLGPFSGILPKRSARACCAILCCLILLLAGSTLRAQDAGDGQITGTVTDKSGAVVPKATVVATNTDTGVQTTKITNGSGDYSLSLQAGHYNIEVTAKGFQRLLQEDVTLDSVQKLGLNIKLSVGSSTTTVTVTTAPAALQTQDGSIGGTIENELYTELPLSMGGAPRDPTAFAFLMPGVLESASNATGTGNGTQTGTYGGSGAESMNENYLDGVPMTNISSQGDPTPIRNGLSVDAVDQFSVTTNGASTSFGGVGVTNYTIKAGGNALHGTIFDYVRNTMFDTWGYFSKVPQANGYATKPGEHQNSYGGSLGGPIIKDKLFYFGTYEGFHYTKVSNTPQYLTIPTVRNRNGDFTDAFGSGSASGSNNTGIWDPTTSWANQFQGLLNGVPTNNVIPQSEISPISWYLQNGCQPVGCAAKPGEGVPQPVNLSTNLNYLAGLPLENDDYTIDARLDYTISARHKLSIIGIGGNHGFGGEPKYNNLQEIPFPYAAGVFTNQKTSSGVLTYTFVATQTLINSLKYGYSRTWGQGFAITKGTKWTSAKAGINNTPGGNATDTMPAITFTGNEPSSEALPTNWASNPSTGPVATNTYTIIDNLQWLKGRHNITFGAQVQWLESNGASYGGYSGTTALSYAAYSTENHGCTNLTGTVSSGNCAGGSAYASFLVGAVYSGNVRTQLVSDYGGRFRPMAPYVQDDWRITPKLTLNLGLRYDYLAPYHEAKDRIAFINPNIINPITGTPGVVMYAGYPNSAINSLFLPYICHCHSPATPYKWNLEPRLGFAYAVRQNTVIRGSFGIMNTHAGAAGGGQGPTNTATTGTGNNAEYALTTSWTQFGSSTGNPAFYLNPSIVGAPPSTCGVSGANCTSGAPYQTDFSSLPGWTPAGNLIAPLATTGNYGLNGFLQYGCLQQANGTCQTGTQNFADMHYGGRGPQFVNYNLGFQQMINKKAVLSVNYAGSETHFLPGGAGRGYAQNGISPDYDQPLQGLLNTVINSGAGPTIAAVQAIYPNYHLPYTNYQGTNATVARSLSAFPQYNGFTDLWGETGNTNYNSLQVSVIQRPWHNLSGFANYTYSKTMGDTGNHRTQYPLGPQDGNFQKVIPANRVDWALSTFDQRHVFNATWLYTFPIGRGQKFFATNRIIGAIGGGWSLSGIYKYRQGNPLQITDNAICNPHQYGLQGTCMPDQVPGFSKSQVRINGRWGHAPGATASNIQTVPYINANAFECPDSLTGTAAVGATSSLDATCGTSTTVVGVPTTWKIGNAPESAPYGLTGPGWWDIDLGIRRTFNVIQKDTLHLTFDLSADVINTTNSTFFNLGGSSQKWDVCPAGETVQQCSAAQFGAITGQNQNIPPRDWQFSGRFRF